MWPNGIDCDWKFLESMGLNYIFYGIDYVKAEEPSSLNEPLVGLLF